MDRRKVIRNVYQVELFATNEILKSHLGVLKTGEECAAGRGAWGAPPQVPFLQVTFNTSIPLVKKG